VCDFGTMEARDAKGTKLNLTVREVEETRGVRARQLALMRMRGDGPRWIKVAGKLGCRGGRVLYPAAALDAWLAQLPGGGGVSGDGGDGGGMPASAR